MLIITIQVNTTGAWAQTAKESISYDLEKYGDVRVLEIKEVKPPAPKQMKWMSFVPAVRDIGRTTKRRSEI